MKKTRAEEMRPVREKCDPPTASIDLLPHPVHPGGSNLQHYDTIAFLLLLVHANYLSRTTQTASINCREVSVGPTSLRQQAIRQVDYSLGDNPKGMSDRVGYGGYYPQRAHHGGSSIPSIRDHPQLVAYKEGSLYLIRPHTHLY
ncbi:hypothetical protein SAY87_011327 [Trapa incisa]|uniref:cellulase n=1 Tax=Trapa incisa TaxID=236973 RepID=A0AAN7JJ18_9MYRT|nr:hypothetical protein SAY87_011327 [Trapa incisa]